MGDHLRKAYMKQKWTFGLSEGAWVDLLVKKDVNICVACSKFLNFFYPIQNSVKLQVEIYISIMVLERSCLIIYIWEDNRKMTI